MNTLDLIEDLVYTTIDDKWRGVKEYIEGVCSIIPTKAPLSCFFPYNENNLLTTFLEFESEDEKDSTIKYITESLNKLNIAYNESLFLIYSQMEGILKVIIRDLDTEHKYEQYDRQHNNMSKFKKYINFLVAKKNYTLKNFQITIIEIMDSKLRPNRNKFAHESIIVYTVKDSIAFIDDGVDLESKLLSLCSNYIEEINAAIEISGHLYSLCREICN